MPLLTLNLSCENVKYPARKHFEKTNKILYSHGIKQQQRCCSAVSAQIQSDTVEGYASDDDGEG